MANQNWRKNIAALQLTSTAGIPQLSNDIQTKVMEFLTGKKTKAAINTPRKVMERAKFAYEIGKSANRMRHGRELGDFIVEQLQFAHQDVFGQANHLAYRIIVAEREGDYGAAARYEEEETELRDEAMGYQEALDHFFETGRLPDNYIQWLYDTVESIDPTAPEAYQEAKADWLSILREVHADVLAPEGEGGAGAGGRRKTRKSKRSLKKNQKSRRKN